MKAIDFRAIAQKISSFPLPPFDCVVGIAEGGTVPATLVAQKLGCDLHLTRISYRNNLNEPMHPEPLVIDSLDFNGAKNILIVDDVSVSGKTLEAAKKQIAGARVSTLVLKGRADFVLFPEIESCVLWPWTPREKKEGSRHG